MKAYDIGWHEKCLENRKASLERKKIELAKLQAEVDKGEQEVKLYELQIAEARRRGKDKFNPERFLKAQANIH